MQSKAESLGEFHAGAGVDPSMSVWQGVAKDSLKFHPSPPCPTLLHPAGGPPLKLGPCGLFRVGHLRAFSTPLDTPRRTFMPGVDPSGSPDRRGDELPRRNRRKTGAPHYDLKCVDFPDKLDVNRASEGSSKASLKYPIPYRSMLCGRPTAGQPNCCLGISHP
jgi:hypothetical protein